jgi:GDP-D-mannose dehydratase
MKKALITSITGQDGAYLAIPAQEGLQCAWN